MLMAQHSASKQSFPAKLVLILQICVARFWQDEVDILRERSGRLTTAESTIDSMRKKVEEGNELKRQLRKLDEKNAQYVQQNMELEEVRQRIILPSSTATATATQEASEIANIVLENANMLAYLPTLMLTFRW